MLNNYYIFNTNDFLNNIYGNNISVSFNSYNSNNNFDLLETYKNELNLTTDFFFKSNFLNITENNVFFFILMPVLLYTFIIIFSLIIEISSVRNNFLHFISFFFISLWFYIIFDVFIFNSLDYTTNNINIEPNNNELITNFVSNRESLLNNSTEILFYNNDSFISNYIINFKKLGETFNFYGHFLLDQHAFWFVDYVYNIVKELNNLILFLNTNIGNIQNLLLDNFSNSNLIYYFFNEISFNSFSIIIISILLFFISFLFLGFIDKFFINENKNFEFSWLLWLFLMSSIFLFLSKTFIQIFICLECISFCSYILISLERYRKLSAISGVRYLVISAIPSVFLILGLIFMYKDFTSFDVDVIYNLFQTNLNVKYITYYDTFINYYNDFFLDYKLYNNIHIENFSVNNTEVWVTKLLYNSLIDPIFLIINDLLPNLKYIFNWTDLVYKNEILNLNEFLNLSIQREYDLNLIKQQLILINLLADYGIENNNIENFIYSNEYQIYLKRNLNLNDKELLLFLQLQQEEASLFLGFGNLVHFIDLTGLDFVINNINSNIKTEVFQFWINYTNTLNNLKTSLINEINMNNFVTDSFNHIIINKSNLIEFSAIQHNIEIEKILNILNICDNNELINTNLFLEAYKNFLYNLIHNNFDVNETLVSNQIFSLLSLLEEKDLRLFKFGLLEHSNLTDLLINFRTEILKNIQNNELPYILENDNLFYFDFDNTLFNVNNNYESYFNYIEILNYNPYLKNIRTLSLNSNIFNEMFSYQIVEDHVKIPNWLENRLINFVHWFFDTYTPTENSLYYIIHEFLPNFYWKENLRLTNLGLKVSQNLNLLEKSLNDSDIILYKDIYENILIKEGLNLVDASLNIKYNNNMTELSILESGIQLGESILLEEDFKNQTFIVSPFNGNIVETINNTYNFSLNTNNTKLAILPLMFFFNLDFNKLTNNTNSNNFFINNYNFFFENSNFTFLSYFIASIFLILIFLIINFSFKVTAAPFHIWAPTIYNEGTLSSVIFLSIFTKLTLFLFAINLFDVYLGFLRETWIYIFLILGLLSVIIGSLGAINERFIKKFFVYSSMVDVGFLFLAFSFFPNLQSYGYIFLYLLVYNLSSLIIWFFISYIRNDTKFLTNLISILNKSWPIQFIFALVIFSMAGIPPFAGFFIKLNILIGLESSERNALVFLILLFTVLSLFYYLRLIKIIQFDNISFSFYTNFVKPNVLFFSSFFIFILIFFIFFVNKNLLVIFQEAFLTSKILDIQDFNNTLLNIEFNKDHWPETIDNNKDLGYWTLGRYLAFRQYWDEIILPNNNIRWVKDTLTTLSLLGLTYFLYIRLKKKNT